MSDTPQELPLSPENRKFLRGFLQTRFSFRELKGIAFDLVEHTELLHQDTFDLFVMDLIKYFEHRRTMLSLLHEIDKERPDNDIKRIISDLQPLQVAAPGGEPAETQAEQYLYRLSRTHEFEYLKLIVADNKFLPLQEAYIQLKIVEKEVPKYRPEEDYRHQESVTPNLFYAAMQDRLQTKAQTALAPLEMLAKHSHAVIIGDPGAGKSTTLRYLTRQVAIRNPELAYIELPVFVPLDQFAHAAQSDLTAFLSQYLETQHNFKDCHAYLTQKLETGKVLILLDGLDEVSVAEGEAQASYDKVIKAINTLHSCYPDTPVLVTCRKAGWKGGLDGFQVLEVLDFQPADIEKFVNRWFEPDTAKAVKLNAALRSNVRIRLLAANPLLLSLICYTYEQDNSLPESRARLYEKCVDWLMLRWDTRRGLDRRNRYSAEKKQELLEELALYFQEKRHRYFERTELMQQIVAAMPKINLTSADAPKILDELLENQGLLEQEGIGWYGFPHLTLQEYFAATRLRKDSQWERATQHAGDPWWEEVILLAGGIGNAAPLLENLLQPPDDIFHTKLLLGCQLVCSSQRIDPPSLRQIIIARTRALLHNSRQPMSMRERAILPLAQLGHAERKSLIELCFQEQDSVVIENIIAVVGSLADDLVVSELLMLFKREQRWGMQMSIMEVMGMFSDDKQVSSLWELFKQEQNWLVRKSIVEAIGNLGDSQQVLQLWESLKQEQNFYVRSSIVKAIGNLGDNQQVLQLWRLLGQERDRFVRSSIVEAIGNLCDSQQLPMIWELFKQEQDLDLRNCIIEVIGKYGDNQQVAKLWELFKQEQDSNLRSSIIEAIGELADSQIVPRLLQLLSQEQDSNLRSSIIKALGKLGNSQTVPLLLQLLSQEPSSDVRWSIIETLGKLGDSQAVPPLLQLLSQKQDGDVRMSINHALGKLIERPQDLMLLAQQWSKEFDIGDTLYEAALRLKVSIYQRELPAGGFEYYYKPFV